MVRIKGNLTIMNYTDSQLATWKNQLGERDSNPPSSLTIRKFLQQITNEVSVKMHKNCILDAEDCAMSLQNNSCIFFKLPGNEKDAEIANKEAVEKAQLRYSNKASRYKTQADERQINSKIVSENSEDSAVIISEPSRSDSSGEISILTYLSNDNSDDFLCSTPKAVFDQSSNNNAMKKNSIRKEVPNKRKVYSVKKKQTSIREDVYKKKTNLRRQNANQKNKSQNFDFSQGGSSQTNRSFQTAGEDIFTFQNLLEMMTEGGDDKDIVNGKKYIEVGPTGGNEGDEIVIKFPGDKCRRATIDLRASKNIADLMFLPVLADEKERLKKFRQPAPAVSAIDITECISTKTTSTSSIQLPGKNSLPEFSEIASIQQQGPFAFINPSFTFYQPNLETEKGQRNNINAFNPVFLQNNQDGPFQSFIGNAPMAIPIFLIPPPVNINNNNRTVNQNRSDFENTTHSMPVRVTSLNGYDSTHYVDLPPIGPQNVSSSTTQNRTLNSSECNTFEFSKNRVTNFQNKTLPLENHTTLDIQPKKKRGRKCKNQAPNQVENLPKAKIRPKKRPSNTPISYKNPKHIIKVKISKKQNMQVEKSCIQSQEEDFVKNNNSFLPCLDMPLLNEETPSENIYEGQSFAGKIPQSNLAFTTSLPMDLDNLVIETTKIYNQFNVSTSSFVSNSNIQPTYTNCTNSKSVENPHTAITYSSSNDIALTNDHNELLERFFVGEVGEIIGNEIDSSFNQEQLIYNKILQDTIVYDRPTTESLITTVQQSNNDDLLLVDKNIVPFNTNENNDIITIISSKNTMQKTHSPIAVTNHSETCDLNAKPSNPNATTQFFYTSHSFDDDMFGENLTSPVYTNFITNDQKESYDCCTSNELGAIDKSLLPIVATKPKLCETQIKENDKNVGNAKTVKNNNLINGAKEHQNPIDLESQSKDVVRTTTNIYSYNNFTSDTCSGIQSEHMQSPFAGFSERIEISEVSYENEFRAELSDEYIEIKTPPSNKMIKKQPSSFFSQKFFAKNMNNTPTKNAIELSPINPTQEELKLEDKDPIIKKQSDTVIQSSLTGKSSSLKRSSLEKSDLFLPPLELESKLNNDVLDFECESILSSKDSHDPLPEDDNKSLSDNSIKYAQSSTGSNEETKNAMQEEIVLSHPLEPPSERVKSWLEDTNNRIGLNQKNNCGNLYTNNQGKMPSGFYKVPAKFLGNKMTSRRNSEICVSRNELRTAYQQSIDTIPVNLSYLKTQNLFDTKNSMSIQQSNFNEDNIPELMKKRLSTHDNGGNSVNKNAVKGFFGSSAIPNMGSLHNTMQALSQNSSMTKAMPQPFLNANSPSYNAQLQDYKQNQFPSTETHIKNPDIEENPFYKFRSNNESIEDNIFPNEETKFTTHSVIDIAKFFNITCLPSLSEKCPYGALCSRSHNLRDLDEVRTALDSLSMNEVNILYKFICAHKLLYTYYFNQFCYYYAENRKIKSLCRMCIDCQRYQSFHANKLMIIYNCLLDCGLTKENACKTILKHSWRRSSEFVNTIMDIIVQSDWTLFSNYVREIISDPNIILTGNTLEKMAQSFINNPDDSKLGLFWQCIFKLDAAELQATQGHPAIQMIGNTYNIMLSLTNFCQNNNGSVGINYRRNSGLF